MSRQSQLPKLISLSGIRRCMASISHINQSRRSLTCLSTSGYVKRARPWNFTPVATVDSQWFHGNANDKPTEVMTLTPGTDLTVELACRKEWSSYDGGKVTADGCPNDSGAYHAGGTTNLQSGWEGNSESNLLGCALAIAFKSSAADTQPEDFTVMSVQEQCIRQRQTTFSLPANLPACPKGGCTCAWFWQGKNSALEMYMTGFRCDVQGGVATASYPTPAAPRRGRTITGPTQPMYWANTPTNLDYTPTYATKPSYNSAFGWKNGAQTSAFGDAAGGNDTETSTSTSRDAESLATSTASSSSVSGERNPTIVATNDAAPTTTVLPDDATVERSLTDGTTSRPSSTSAGEEGEDTPSLTTSSRRRRPTSSGHAGHKGHATWYNDAALASTGAEAKASPTRCKAGKQRRRRRAHAA